MEAVPSPQSVGREFVRQYYTLLNKAPLHLHRFYSHDSSFVHGGLKEGMAEEVHGQQQIHEKIMELDFHDCKAKILLVDSHRTLENGVVVQVSGELSNNGQPMRRFVQTFVLAPQSAKKYYVRNDIFRYQDDIVFDDEDANDERASLETEEPLQPRTVSENQPAKGHVAPLAPASVPVSAEVKHTAPGMNGTDHAEEESQRPAQRPMTTPSPFTAPVAAPILVAQQPEVAAPPTVTPTPAAVSPPVESAPPAESVETVPEVDREPEPAPATADIPLKPTAEPAPVISNAPPEPKTYANLFKSTPSQFNGPTPGLPTTLPPFGAARSTAASTAQTNNEPSPAPAAVNGTTSAPAPLSGDAYPPAGQTQRNSNTFPRTGRPPPSSGMGNGRMGSNAMGPNSYNRDRDQDRGEKERAPSRDSTEEIGEWRHQNGDGNRERDREFRRYDDNLQVFVGNIPHSATEEMLKELFQQFGNVVDVRIQGKGIRLQNGGGRAPAPYYGFVVFDAPEAAEAALAKKPLLLNGEHRLNVEQKRRGGTGMGGPRDGPRTGPMGRGGGMGMSNRGRPGGGPMGMGQPRDGGAGGRGGMSGGPGGRGGYTNRR